MKKICKDCNVEKELDEFSKAPTNRDGYSTRCKKCLSRYQIINKRKRCPLKKRRHEGYITGTKEWRKSCYLYSTFGVTLKEYNEFLIKQKNRCKICNRPIEQFNKMLSVDHDHITGFIRGLLCQNCNAGLGFFKDDIQLLKNVINYLKNSNKSI